MHELAVTEYVFNLVKKQADAAGASHVNKIHLLMGDQCDYVPEIIEEYLQVMSEGTPLEGVKVDAEVKESMILCKDCGTETSRHDFKDTCPRCGGENLRLRRCTEFVVKNIEVC
ncbi:hydrogenase maturation nickel metallochaperone HypA [Pseudobutyrivibrio xylanivorans]|uniref:Hydrogenase maturation nickel metallochaperone HypA n=1 Tax=Pseudobutyrivibrio xylanivorans TaxID=185007 RepID=A0A5P6VTZ2_PSEXY|nr:hydrogenase maturation nickel metallochaperone HypA [Pseudobutyrivibrio xylanivorans]QFJ56106.1 hydrogenase maturation nickel metallochaperone HypA [Pseudobutyrivibrio xylanivorans]